MTDPPHDWNGLLANDEAFLHRAINSMPQMVWTATGEGVCDFLSARWVEYTGIPEAQQLGAGWIEQVHRDDRANMLAAWQAAVISGRDLHANFRIRRADGMYRWFDTRAIPLRDALGRIVKWLGTNTDVHEIFEARTSLAANEERLRYVSLATHDSIYDWDMRAGTTFLNDRYRTHLGVPETKESARHWWERRIHPDDRVRVIESATSAFANGLPTWSCEYRLRRLDGSYANVSDQAYLLYDAHGAPLRVIGAIVDITDRVRTEGELRDARARLLSAIEGADMAAWSWDVDTGRMEWDDAAYRLWGIEREPGYMDFSRAVHMIHPDDRPDIEAAVAEFFRTGVNTTVEFRTIRPDGSIRWLQVRGQAQRDASGRPVRLAGVYIDMTDRKQIEQDLREAKLRLQSAMQAGGLATWTWDIVNNALLMDDDACALWGRAPGEISSLTFEQLMAMIHPEDRENIISANERFYRTGVDSRVEFRPIRPDGALQWLATKGQVERDAQGQPVRMIGVYVDVTERKLIEQALHDSEVRLKSAMQAAGLATWIWDIANDEMLWDDAAYRMWGRSREAMGKISSSDVIATMHPDDQAAITSTRDDFRLEGHDRASEFRIVRPDGTERWIMAKGQFEPDASGKPARMVGVYLDITERKHSEEAQLRAQKMEALGTLAGGIAHDFNNILLAITGNARLINEDLSAGQIDVAALRKSALEITRAGERAADLVKRILTFSRHHEAKHEVVQLRRIVEEALLFLRPTLPATIEIRVTISATEAAVDIDAIQLQQVLMNLVTNSAHAIGSKNGRIEIGVDQVVLPPDRAAALEGLLPGQYACLTVTDNGCGIDTQVMPRIFDPFFTTKLSGQGTGLGLAVVHGIVKANSGAIAVESQAGVGTLITVYLPAAVAAPPAREATALPPAPRGGGRILYVDDEEALVLLTSRILERLGYRVTGFLDPVQALADFKQNRMRYDAVVTDLSMRGMNGFELAAAIRAVRADIPIVLTSGYVRTEDRDAAARVGIRELILKPNTVDEMGLALHRVLSGLSSHA